MNKIRNVSWIYYLSDSSPAHYDVVTIEATAPTYEFDDEFIRTINEQRVLTMEMEYRI